MADILNLELTPLIIQRFGWNEEALQALNEKAKTWAHLAALQVVGEEDLVAERLQVALDFHRSVSDQAVAHLNLLYDNTVRAPWRGTGRPPGLGTGHISSIACSLLGKCRRTSQTCPRQSLQCSCGETMACMRASSSYWLLGSFWPLAISWMQRGSMLDGRGPVLLKEPCIS